MKSEIEVPDGWKVIPLGKILDVGTGKKNVQDSIENGKYPFFTRSVETQRINSWSYDCEGLFIAGEGNFSVRYYKGKFELHQRCYLLSALGEKSISMKFLQNAIQIKINNLIRTAVKSTVISLRKPIIENLKVLLPPLAEQQKIADILSKVDEQIDLNEKIIDKTEELKKGLMQKLLTKGIGHNKFKKTAFGEIPEEWDIVRLSETGDSNNSIVAGPFGSNLKVCDYRDSGVPIIRLQNIERNQFVNKTMKYISKDKAEELKYHSFKSGDIVLAKLGDPIGKTCIIPNKLDFGIVVADVVRIRPSKEKAYYKFIEFLLNSDYCFKQLSMRVIGSTRPRVNLSHVRNLNIILPPINEQKQIASILSKVDEQIQDNKKELNHLKELKKGLMQDLLTGKVRVTT